MNFIEKLSGWVGKYMAFIVVVVAAAALFMPETLIWIKTKWITTLLMIVMFGMGLTLSPEDFAIVFHVPRMLFWGVSHSSP